MNARKNESKKDENQITSLALVADEVAESKTKGKSVLRRISDFFVKPVLTSEDWERLEMRKLSPSNRQNEIGYQNHWRNF